MNKIRTDAAWDDYMYWHGQDKKTVKRINMLINDIDRNPFDGIGKPELLKYNYQGYRSRRIDEVNRLVYQINDGNIYIFSCRYHYE